jgi:glycosyltransferase involved in cell wall biosynthesis/predicted O-methyltransferase YrrM
MPTYNRRVFIPHAIRYFLRQDYPNKELIILDDGEDKVADLIPQKDNIHYYAIEGKITLGEKMNRACQLARGNIIVNWDDDDWYAPWRLTCQANVMQESDVAVCGINQLLYYDLQGGNSFLYRYPENQRIWLLGSSLCFTRAAWERNRFAEINVGMDGLFVWATPEEQVRALENYAFSVHMIHPQNVSPKQTNNSWWHHHPLDEIKATMGDDWSVYARWNSRSSANLPPKPTDKLKNVFACLVHEKPDCVLDLVKNLRYFHPDSTILLYNGGHDAQLLDNSDLTNTFNAIIYPDAKPQPYGYLHGFAFDCIAYALEHLAFDTLTIVDSDQLALRSGYEDYLTRYLKQYPKAGLLSMSPDRVTAANQSIYVASQAFKEYDLWKPLLDTFPDGDSKFVHWTFWPATVFTRVAAQDLMVLYRENEQVQHILAQSKIWASEEVFFPTFISLLGYDVVKHPCNYDYTKFRQQITPLQLEMAWTDDTVFWLHPVNRELNDPIRQIVRQRTEEYRLKPNSDHLFKPYIQTIKPITGWLSDHEALLLARSLYNCLSSSTVISAQIVEVGSYHGKATILMGQLIRDHFPDAQIHAIDPHDGLLGDADKGLQHYPPSFDEFQKNIEKAGLRDRVTTIQSTSTDVEWNQSITFLLIDGLHDYRHIEADFQHFAPWLPPGAIIAFHDYADYYPGVKAFVDELLVKNEYALVQKEDSLVIVKKQTLNDD